MSYKGFGKLKLVKNKNPKFGSNSNYFSVRIYNTDNEAIELLLTESDIKRAKERAAKNSEDIPYRPWWRRLQDWMTK